MYQIEFSNRFKKDVKLCIKRGLGYEALKAAVETLAQTGTLPNSYRPHKLTGNYADCWECHIKPDWLLVWKQNDTELTLLFLRTGSHSDIF